MTTLSVALTGNPNTGKSTIFNELTGVRQKIGNWPGVTVDKKMGYVRHKDRAISVVDLPGTYSITARSPEEQIVIDYLLQEHPDIVVDVVDASNIERNLFLTVQLLEKRIPILIVLNMMDEANRRGIKLSSNKLSRLIGMPVVETVGRKSNSIKKLLGIFTTTVMSNYHNTDFVEEHIQKVEAIDAMALTDEEKEAKKIELRYAFIDEIIPQIVDFSGVASVTTTEKIDRVLANGFLALPILLLLLYSVFELTFTWIGQPVADFLDFAINGWFSSQVDIFLGNVGVAPWLHSLIVNGIIAGVGSVLTFVPLIFTLFFCLSFLDGTGYMARVAFIMDPIMRRAGLTGKGIMPLIMGFGCGVPAIMGARALDSEKDRMISILVTPFLTCGAKLPIMALFAAIFFPNNASNVVFSMYIIGIVVAILMAKVLNVTTFKDKKATFLLELPPYRFPDMKTVFLETWDKGKGYLVKAGTIIFAMSVLIWLMSNYNLHGSTDEMSQSFLAFLGATIAPFFTWLGFPTWEAGAAVITGIVAKEAVISTMGILYNVTNLSDDTIAAAHQMLLSLGGSFTALSALSFMVFTQLYSPCVTALGTIKKETGKWKWVAFAFSYTTFVAWFISLLVYQVGSLLGY